MEVELSVETDLIEQGSRVNVRVRGDDKIGEWYTSVAAENGTIMSAPTLLSAHGRPTKYDDGTVAYEFWVSTMGYECGGYRIIVAPTSDPLDKKIRIAKFVVEEPVPVLVSVSPNYSETRETTRRVVR